MAPMGAPRCRIETVPELSRFFGIIIRMFAEPGAPHHSAHFHAYYQSEIGIFGIDPVELIAGSLPRRQRDGWWKRGRSYIKLSCEPIGIGCKKDRDQHPSSH